LKELKLLRTGYWRAFVNTVMNGMGVISLLAERLVASQEMT